MKKDVIENCIDKLLEMGLSGRKSFYELWSLIKKDSKVDNFLELTYIDSDGIWISLKKGFCTDPELHTIHVCSNEDGNITYKEMKEAYNELQRAKQCNCKNCKAGVV